MFFTHIFFIIFRNISFRNFYRPFINLLRFTNYFCFRFTSVFSLYFSNFFFNSGSICLGKYAVMAMTDYNAGSNHVLPTNGSAKYSSGISVNEFYKRISYINLSKKGIESLGPSVITLANHEGLVGHAQSVFKRIRRK